MFCIRQEQLLTCTYVAIDQVRKRRLRNSIQYVVWSLVFGALFYARSPLSTALGRSGAKLALGKLLQPALLPDDVANLVILGTVCEKVHPALKLAVNSRLGLLHLLLLHGGHLGRGPLGVDLGVVDGEVHLFDAAHIGVQVLLEATRDKRAGGIAPSKDAVGAALAVHVKPIADVVDGAVNGEIERLALLGSVKCSKFGRCKVDWDGLYVWCAIR